MKNVVPEFEKLEIKRSAHFITRKEPTGQSKGWINTTHTKRNLHGNKCASSYYEFGVANSLEIAIRREKSYSGIPRKGPKNIKWNSPINVVGKRFCDVRHTSSNPKTLIGEFHLMMICPVCCQVGRDHEGLPPEETFFTGGY